MESVKQDKLYDFKPRHTEQKASEGREGEDYNGLQHVNRSLGDGRSVRVHSCVIADLIVISLVSALKVCYRRLSAFRDACYHGLSAPQPLFQADIDITSGSLFLSIRSALCSYAQLRFLGALAGS